MDEVKTHSVLTLGSGIQRLDEQRAILEMQLEQERTAYVEQVISIFHLSFTFNLRLFLESAALCKCKALHTPVVHCNVNCNPDRSQTEAVQASTMTF